MTVKELIELLNKIENKDMQVNFSYDSRCGAREINAVDIQTYEDLTEVYFRGEDDVERECFEESGLKDYIKNIRVV